MTNDLRFALRMILAHRWFSAAVVVTLALGIGANTMVLHAGQCVLLRPPAVPGGERLVAISYSNPSHGNLGMRLSYPDFRAYRDGASSFESIQTGSSNDGVLSDRGHSSQTYNLEVATPGIFCHAAHTSRARPRFRSQRRRRGAGGRARVRRLEATLQQLGRRDRSDGTRQWKGRHHHRRHA